MNQSKNTQEIPELNEFKTGVTDEFDVKEMSGISRRRFLALVGASAAFAATACNNYRDKGEIMPYVQKPEEVMPGKANYYASTCSECPLSCGTLIKTREGRPVKIIGNPEHPINKGKICAAGEATVLNLYDPERIKFPQNIKGSDLALFRNDITKESWKNADNEIVAALNKAVADNKEIAIVSHSVTSPSLAALFNDFKAKYPTAAIYSYEQFDDSNRIMAWEKTYGCNCIPAINWEEATVILSLEADILGNEGSFLEQIRAFTSNRDADAPDKFVRLYSAEAGMTITGMNADYRFRLRPEQQYSLVLAILNEIIYIKRLISFSIPSEAEHEIRKFFLSNFANDNKLNLKNLRQMVVDLVNARGNSIVYAGSQLDESTHIAVNLLNEVLGNAKLYSQSANKVLLPLSKRDELKALIHKLKSGNVSILIHFNSNPAYHFPEEWGYEKAARKAGKVISLVESKNESSVLSKLLLPINHYLESWGDHQTRDGVLSLQQPVIAPIHNTRQKEAILLNWMSEKPENYNVSIYLDYIRARWEKEVYPSMDSPLDFKRFWNASLQSGLVITKTTPCCEMKFNMTGNLTKPDMNGFALIIASSYFLLDGKFANNGWLQEIPHPVTKVTWDNYASLSEATAKALGLKMEDKVLVSLNGKSVELPVMIQPGMPENTVVVEYGYGRTVVGDVGKKVGINVNNLISESAFSKNVSTGAKVSKASGKYRLAATQEHHAITDPKVKDIHLKRKIIIEGTVAGYKNNPDSVRGEEHHEIISIVPPKEYTGVKWAMAIDLNKCIGCSQCVASCNVENNLPVVGRDQVLNGREMHWIRLDRYYSGSNEEPDVSVQPMLCSHCDNAPCENVCPVVATNHSPDGLNQMVYNRCVGTRYCSNNCPYKVRRYNFFNFRDHFRDGYYQQDTLKLLHNPEVTVRSRGVMEKCTFCLQRIMEARQDAIREGRELKGDDVRTACQISCPADAIVFGDMNNKESAVSKKREHKLNYYVFPEINVKPNLSYIAKLKNKYMEEA